MILRKLIIPAIMLLILTAACVRPTPVAVYVTPTPQTTDVATNVPAVQIEATGAIVVPTVVPQSTSAPVGPTSTIMGPVVGPDYTLPPPATAQPTETTRPIDTLTPAPSVTPVPTDTPGGPTATALPGLDAALMGVQVHSELEQADWNNTMHRATEIKVNWIKVQVAWELIQPTGAGDFSTEFQRLELYLQDADRRGFNILISVAKAPNWARNTLEEDGPPRDPAILAAFLDFFLRQNNLGLLIDAIEVWNEPNLAREWRGASLGGGEYMRYFDAAYAAIRGYSSDIVIITAAPAPTGTSDFSVDDRQFVRQMYQAGLGQYQGDSNLAVGVHPYSWGNPPDVRCCNAVDGQSWDDNVHFFFADTLEDYREIMVANGHSSMKMWATEFGWATWAGLPGDPPEAWMGYNTPQDQAAYTVRAFELAQNLDYMGPMIIWNLNLAQVNPELIEERDERIAYSLVLPEGNPQERPLYWQLYDAPRINPTPTPTS